MDNLRKLFRDQARAMKWEFAIVEQIYRGMATVNLDGSSKRVTNIPVIGEGIAVGDTVIVDYSSEIPCVRRLKETVVEQETELAAAAKIYDPYGITREDIGFSVCVTYYNMYPQDLYPTAWPGQPYLIPFGLNPWDDNYDNWWESAVQWDVGGHVIGSNELRFLGNDWVTIRKTGRYYLRIYWNSGFPYSRGTDLPYGGQWARILKNFNTSLLQINQRHTHGYYGNWDRPGMSGMTVYPLTEGDKLSLEFTFDRTDLLSQFGNEWSFSYDDSDLEWLTLTAQYVPGT